jgi:hypothetical protein
MIHNDKELQATQERIVFFQSILAQLRVTAKPSEFPLVSSGYKAEIEKMQAEIMEYLSHHSSEVLSTVNA